jgi:hypothetical protein
MFRRKAPEHSFLLSDGAAIIFGIDFAADYRIDFNIRIKP